jgi:hypothetical protein
MKFITLDGMPVAPAMIILREVAAGTYNRDGDIDR